MERFHDFAPASQSPQHPRHCAHKAQTRQRGHPPCWCQLDRAAGLQGAAPGAQHPHSQRRNLGRSLWRGRTVPQRLRCSPCLHRCFEADVVVVPVPHSYTTWMGWRRMRTWGRPFCTSSPCGARSPRGWTWSWRRASPRAFRMGIACGMWQLPRIATYFVCVHPLLALAKKALKRISRAQGSKFALAKKWSPASGGFKKCDSASGAVLFNDLGDLVSWACSARRAENEAGPKVFAAEGRAIMAA